MAESRSEEEQNLESHIISEMEKWKRRTFWFRDEERGRYSSLFVEFSSFQEISAGEIMGIEIHVGNITEFYTEIVRFRPQRLRLVAVPNHCKEEWPENHCYHVDYFTHTLYQHPDGTWYSSRDVGELPFDYEVKNLLNVPKANKLLKRNQEVLEEIENRIEYLQEMREKITRGK